MSIDLKPVRTIMTLKQTNKIKSSSPVAVVRSPREGGRAVGVALVRHVAGGGRVGRGHGAAAVRRPAVAVVDGLEGAAAAAVARVRQEDASDDAVVSAAARAGRGRTRGRRGLLRGSRGETAAAQRPPARTKVVEGGQLRWVLHARDLGGQIGIALLGKGKKIDFYIRVHKMNPYPIYVVFNDAAHASRSIFPFRVRY